MSPEDIARAFAACSGFEWIPGMNDPREGTITSIGPLGFPWVGRVKLLCAVPDVANPQTLAIIAYVLLPKRWPGHSVQVEVFPDGTARVVVLRPLLPGVWGAGVVVFRVSHEPVAVSLLRALEASP